MCVMVLAPSDIGAIERRGLHFVVESWVYFDLLVKALY